VGDSGIGAVPNFAVKPCQVVIHAPVLLAVRA
jgi:hypothetical protein